MPGREIVFGGISSVNGIPPDWTHIPCQLSVNWPVVYDIPPVPITNPTRFAASIVRILNTPPTAHACRYHRCAPNCGVSTCVFVNGKFALTLDRGNAVLAINSGIRNKLTNHPHARSLNDRSCQSATNVKMRTLEARTFFVPPSGI